MDHKFNWFRYSWFLFFFFPLRFHMPMGNKFMMNTWRFSLSLPLMLTLSLSHLELWQSVDRSKLCPLCHQRASIIIKPLWCCCVDWRAHPTTRSRLTVEKIQRRLSVPANPGGVIKSIHHRHTWSSNDSRSQLCCGIGHSSMMMDFNTPSFLRRAGLCKTQQRISHFDITLQKEYAFLFVSVSWSFPSTFILFFCYFIHFCFVLRVSCLYFSSRLAQPSQSKERIKTKRVPLLMVIF